MDPKHYVKDHGYQNIPLTFDEAFALGQHALHGCNGNVRAQIQSIAILSALHTKATYAWTWDPIAEDRHGHRLPQNAAEQIAGVCAAVFAEDIGMSEFGFIKPNVPYAMDNCGMGGDLTVTANVSTIAAFIAAAAGIPMCKHGSPANTDRGECGSSDFIALLGIDTYADRDAVVRCVEDAHFGYTEALDVRYKRIHTQTHAVAMLPHMNCIIGPITNPLDTALMTRRVLGTNHLVPPRLVAEAYQILNERRITHLEHGLFIRGITDETRRECVDEASVCDGGTEVAELAHNEIHEYRLHAKDFGVRTVSASAISPPRGMRKGNFSLGILRGEITGPPLTMALANAALLFYLARFSKDFTACYREAARVHADKSAYEKALEISKRLPKIAGR